MEFELTEGDDSLYTLGIGFKLEKTVNSSTYNLFLRKVVKISGSLKDLADTVVTGEGQENQEDFPEVKFTSKHGDTLRISYLEEVEGPGLLFVLGPDNRRDKDSAKSDFYKSLTRENRGKIGDNIYDLADELRKLGFKQ